MALAVGVIVLGVAIAGNVVRVTPQSTHQSSRTAEGTPPVPVLPGAVKGQSYTNVDPSMLSWTAGQSYPQVDGKVIPPPVASLRNAPAAPITYGGHFYAGSVYSGSAVNNTWVLSEITVPSAATPDSSQFYYVLTSIWDNGGSYDQIGFADDYGTWGLVYSYTTGTCSSPTYHYSANYQTLTPGQEYLLAITTSGSTGGSTGTWLEEYTVSSTGVITQIFALKGATGATDPGLQQAGFYCGYYDYTDYEEVYGNTTYWQPDPYSSPAGLTFWFHLNCNGGSGCNSWTTWTAWKSSYAPPGTASTIGKYKTVAELVTIENLKIPKGYFSG
ncbi:MAG TPA: hypothetical protein VGV89_00635 [Thermoplasmata archaeon]|nr:hypothetical protein [Thermoplasmata archaeon]